MNRVVKQDMVEEKIIQLRNKSVILDCDVAELYGVTTKQVNQAFGRNPEKFPSDYAFILKRQEKEEVVTNCDHLQNLKFSPNLPNAFTDLKSPRATETTISIIDTFTRVRAIGKTIGQLSVIQDEKKKNELAQKTGELITDLIVPEDVNNAESEASIELNFAIVKFKYAVKKNRKNNKK